MSILYKIVTYFDNPTVVKGVYTLLTILILFIIQRILYGVVDKKVKTAKHRYSRKKTISYVILIIGIFIMARIWLGGFKYLATYIGLLSAGIAIALKDMLSDLAGWIFIMWRRPFEVGNRIEIGDTAGDVIDIRPFQFTVLEIGNWVKADQSTGRMVHIPNNLIFTQPLCNYDSGFKYIWHEIPVMLTFESNWEKAKDLLTKIANDKATPITADIQKEIESAAKKYMIIYTKLTPIVFTSVEDSGIVLTLRFLTEIRQRRSVAETIWEEILREFLKHDDISLAYNTLRIVQP
jgi:small-conductance mechanosensitive channel